MLCLINTKHSRKPWIRSWSRIWCFIATVWCFQKSSHFVSWIRSRGQSWCRGEEPGLWLPGLLNPKPDGERCGVPERGSEGLASIASRAASRGVSLVLCCLASCCLTFPRTLLSYQNTWWCFLCIPLAVALGFGAVPEEAVGLSSPQAVENVLGFSCWFPSQEDMWVCVRGKSNFYTA